MITIFNPNVAKYSIYLKKRNFEIRQNDRHFTQAVTLDQEIVGHCYVVCMA